MEIPFQIRSSGIAVATSIPPGLTRNARGREIGQEYQDRCVESWLQAGFKVLSVNFAEEIPKLAARYPNIEFIPVERRAEEDILGRGVPAIDDLLRALTAQHEEIVGIINADLLLESKGWIAALDSAVQNGIAVGRRLEIESLDDEVPKTYLYGFDLFFFQRTAAPAPSNRPFAIGRPWWDYLIPLNFKLRGMEIKLLTSPAAFHLTHQFVFSWPTWRFMAKQFVEEVLESASRNNNLLAPELVPIVQLCRKIASDTIFETVPPSLFSKARDRMLYQCRNVPGLKGISRKDYSQDADRLLLSRMCVDVISASIAPSSR